MATPSSATSTLRPELASSMAEFDLEMNFNNFIGARVAPTITVGKPSGAFGKIPIEELLVNRDTRRAPGTGYNRGRFTFQPATFSCEEHGAEEPVDDNERETYGEYVDPEVFAVLRAWSAVMVNFEKRIADLLFNATTWTGSSLTTAPTHEWDDAANAVPITDVEAAVQKVYDGSGLWPDTLIINRKVFRNLRQCSQIIDRCKAQGFMDVRAGEITTAQLAAVFDLPKIIVAGGTKNTANQGQAATPGQIWSGEYAMVAKTADTDDPREPCVARTFHWPGDGSEIDGRVEEYRDEAVRGDVYRVRHQTDELVMYTEAAHLLSNITT